MKFLIIAVVLLSACGASLARNKPPCVRLEHKDCVCENGTVGVQVCRGDGTYSKCFCDVSK